MKTKHLFLFFVILTIVSIITVGFATAKPGAKSPAIAGRPEKLAQMIFVHPVGNEMPGKPDYPPGKPPKDDEPEEPVDNSYYELWGGFLVDTVQYKINLNIPLVTGGDAFAAIESAAESWDIVTSSELFEYIGTTNNYWYAEDGENTVSWVRFTPKDYIAVAVMYYDNNPFSPTYMQIFEVDIIFNALLRWGINPKKKDRAYDVQNIATHEFGHPLGLNDLYDNLYRELTMFGYSSIGEVEKCSLEEGDILGTQALYGP